ncbi:MAG: hypothetical protein WBK91_04715 [Alphaproteobacteria bacterium]
MLRYADLKTRYGEVMAYDLLLIIERMAQIKGDIMANEEDRITKALIALDRVQHTH